MYTAFPCSDYYASSVLRCNHLLSPWLARLRCRAADPSSHVPALDLHLVGGILYPWRCRATTSEEFAVAESDTFEPTSEEHQAPPVQIALTPILIRIVREHWSGKYRGFQRTLCDLTIRCVVARHTVDAMPGTVQSVSFTGASSVHDALGQTPSAQAPSRAGLHHSSRSNASRRKVFDLTHRFLLAVMAH